MKELDFLFLYEHKVRELENLCLIKYELDRRGYRTDIIYIEDAKNALAVKPFIHTKVLLVMALQSLMHSYLHFQNEAVYVLPLHKITAWLQ